MGERFGSYEIEEKLGQGGMAEVFSALRRGEDGFVRRVCIKRMLPEHEGDPTMVELFGDEARIMAGLHHPGIVSVLELGRHAGRSFLAMELVDGVDLRKILRRTGLLSPELAIHVACELASALDHAHRATVLGVAMRVVHRDVTPSNVLVGKDGSVKLTDFGIAKATERAHVTQAGIVKGKVPYMAPEQALGLEVDHRADLFSLGVVLFESLAGRRPYDGPTDLDTLRNAQLGTRPDLRELAPDVPRPLEAVIHRLLEPRVDRRFASAEELLDTLAPHGSLGARRALEKRVAQAIAVGAPAPRGKVRAPLAEPTRPRRVTPVAPAVSARPPPDARPLAPSPTRTELMPPSELFAIEETSQRARPASRASLAEVAALADEDEATEVQPRVVLDERSDRTLAIPPTRPGPGAAVWRVELRTFVAIALSWLVLSMAVGVLWARGVHGARSTPPTVLGAP